MKNAMVLKIHNATGYPPKPEGGEAGKSSEFHSQEGESKILRIGGQM